jgi:FdhD protein
MTNNAAEVPPIPGARPVPVSRVGRGGARAEARVLPEEAPVALVHDAATTAVMMATPADLEDFGLGFSLTEGIVADPAELRGVEIASTDAGVEVRMWLAPDRSEALAARRRRLAGPTGCGLCGLDSLAEAARPVPAVGQGLRVAAEEVWAALQALADAQALGAATRAVHAAGWWVQGAGFAAVREDVGRHNALDKLAGALARTPAPPGVLILTSRISVEMVQKAAVLGAQALVAVSAPTTLALAAAEAAGMTLVGVARADSFEVFTRPERIEA